MAEPYKHIYKVDLNQQMVRRDVGLLATFDSKANRFGAKLYRDGLEVDVSSYTVMGYFIRPDDQTVPIPGTVEGNLVYVDLLPGCYLLDGAFEFSLKIKLGDEELAVLMCYGTVERSRTDATAEGGDVVVTVTDAERLGGKPPEYYLPAVNLLDNPDFAVAQAGYNGLHGSECYAADRWVASNGFTVSHDGVGLKITKDKSAVIYASIRQVVDISNLKGKTVTFAAYCKTTNKMRFYAWSYNTDTDIYTGYVNGNGSEDGVYVVSFVIPASLTDEYAVFSFSPDWDNSGLPVEHLRTVLHNGTYTAETLPPFVPPDPVVELAKCQRYFQIIGGLDRYSYICTGVSLSTTRIRSGIQLPVEMVGTPDVHVYGNMFTVNSYIPITTTLKDACTKKSIMLYFDVAGGLVAGQSYLIIADDDSTARIEVEYDL